MPEGAIIKNKIHLSYLIDSLFMLFLLTRLIKPLGQITILYYSTTIIMCVSTLLFTVVKDNVCISVVATNTYVKWLFCFTAFSFMSYLWAQYIPNSMNNYLVTGFIIMIPLSIYLNREFKIKKAIDLMLFTTFVLEIYILITNITTLPNLAGRLSEGSDIWNANSIGRICSFCALIASYKRIVTKNNSYYLIILISIFIILLTGSRTALLFLFISLALNFSITHKRNRILYILLGITLMLLVAYSVMNIPYLYAKIGYRFDSLVTTLYGQSFENSTSTRLRLIEEGWHWFLNRPWFGHGTDNYRYIWNSIYGRYYYSHNNYIELLVNMGIIGTTLYYALHIWLIVNAINIVKYYDRPRMSLIISFTVAVLLTDISSVSYVNRIDQIVMCILAAIVTFYIEQRKRENYGQNQRLSSEK